MIIFIGGFKKHNAKRGQNSKNMLKLGEVYMILDLQKEKLVKIKEDFSFIKECL